MAGERNAIALHFKDVSVAFEGNVLKNVSFEVPAGRHAFCSVRRGAGKTVTLKTAIGLVRRNRPGFPCCNDIGTMTEKQMFDLPRVGMLFQEGALDSMTIEENAGIRWRTRSTMCCPAK
jgi:ABC-type transporter Mla maintaining outer membrane lipid asymmetry ATPase subunit MlaF